MFIIDVAGATMLTFKTASSAILFFVGIQSVGAQVPPPKERTKLPDAYFRRLRDQPQAFSFSKAYISLVGHILSNRMLVAHSEAPGFALAVASRQGGVAIAGTKSIPVLTAVTPDRPAPPYSTSVIAHEYFDGPWPSETMNSFYGVMSYGNLNVKGVVLSWQMLSHPSDWYAGDDYTDDSGNLQHCYGLCRGSRVGQLIAELLNANRTVNWGQFDNDGPDKLPNSGDDDGYVDFVVVVHPGIGGECGGANNRAIWSHRGQLKYENSVYVTDTPSKTPGFGNIQVNDYVIVPALACDGVHPNPIGIVSHEFGHAFDLPDLYDTSAAMVGGVGDWDLMATGAWGGDDNSPEMPTEMSAWAKERLGWITPIPVTSDVIDIALDPIELTPMAYRITGSGSQYYLLSNRQKIGSDAKLPAGGLLVEAINQDKLDQAWSSNQVNIDPSDLGVQVIEADGGTGLINPVNGPNSYRYAAGDLLPVSPQADNFDATTTPPSPAAFALCGIHQVGNVIHAQLLITSNVCPTSAGAALGVPAAGNPRAPVARPTEPPPAEPRRASIEAIQKNPQLFEGRQVELSGVIENTGLNYFKNLALTLIDQTGRSIPVKITAPTELPPPPPAGVSVQHSGPVSTYLNHPVAVRGTIESTELPGQPKTYTLNVQGISAAAQH